MEKVCISSGIVHVVMTESTYNSLSLSLSLPLPPFFTFFFIPEINKGVCCSTHITWSMSNHRGNNNYLTMSLRSFYYLWSNKKNMQRSIYCYPCNKLEWSKAINRLENIPTWPRIERHRNNHCMYRQTVSNNGWELRDIILLQLSSWLSCTVLKWNWSLMNWPMDWRM